MLNDPQILWLTAWKDLIGWGSGSRFNRIHLASNCWSLVNHEPTRPIISRRATLTCWKRQYTGHFKDVWRPLSTDKQSNRQAHLGRWKRYYHLKRVFHLVYFRRVSLGNMRENYARIDEVLTECYLIGKWGNGDVDQRKFTNSCGRFLWRRTRKKPQKLLMIPGGTSFLFRSDFFYSFGWSFGRSSVGELRELWILASVASTTTTRSTNSWSSTTRFTPQGGGYFISLFIDISKYWKEKGQFFASEFPPSPSWASCLRHEIKCFLHRFVTPEDLLTCHL